MQVVNLILDGTNRHIHDCVYRPSLTGELKGLLGDSHNNLFESVSIRNNPYLRNQAAQIVYIHERSRALMASIVDTLNDDPAYGNLYRSLIETVQVTAFSPVALGSEVLSSCKEKLVHMVSCAPNQGFVSVPKKQISCDQYRLCPWCRYKKARQLFDALVPYLQSEHDICVTHFITPCDPMNFSVDRSEKAYQKVTRAIRDGRDWICDYVISLPIHLRAPDGTYRLVWRTSLIAMVPKDMALKMPEGLAPKKIDGAAFMSDGVVYRYPATSEGLKEAFIPIMAYPKWMLSSTLTDSLLRDVLTILSLGDQYRTVSHGLSFETPEVPESSAES